MVTLKDTPAVWGLLMADRVKWCKGPGFTRKDGQHQELHCSCISSCEALSVQVPTPSIVTVVPATVHAGVVRLLKLTIRPEDAVALTVKGKSP